MKPQVRDQKLLSEMYQFVEGKVDDYIDREKEQGKAPLTTVMRNGADEPALMHHTMFGTHVALRNTPTSKMHHPDHTVPYEEFMKNFDKYRHPYSYDDFMASKTAQQDENEQQKPATMVSFKDGTVIGLDYSGRPIGYKYMGMTNYPNFDRELRSSIKDWKRVYSSNRGNYEIYASPSTKLYYDNDCSD
jgi:hypothetical protein